MRYYRFQTFVTRYYFPEIPSAPEYLYGLYSAYGGFPARCYWYLFRKCSWVRRLTAVHEEQVEAPLKLLRALTGEPRHLSLNMGSPGPERKISLLGWREVDQRPFFAKWSQQPVAMRLTRHEIEIYGLLADTGLTPRLLHSADTENYVFLMTEYVEGTRPAGSHVNDRILALTQELGRHHLPHRDGGRSGLRCCLSHGDFCPWNLLEKDGCLQLIDWEMAAERPLGFDLFTYIGNVSALLEPSRSLAAAFRAHEAFIVRYFAAAGIADWQPYLRAFAEEKVAYERSKGLTGLYVKYSELLQSLRA